jgi:hypothetical protein
MRGLLIEYCRYILEKIGAVVDKPRTLIFKRLKEAIKLRIMAIENA